MKPPRPAAVSPRRNGRPGLKLDVGAESNCDSGRLEPTTVTLGMPIQEHQVASISPESGRLEPTSATIFAPIQERVTLQVRFEETPTLGSEREHTALPSPNSRRNLYGADVPVASGAIVPGELLSLVPGQTLRLGSCDLCFELASGGMATVYLGVHRGAQGFEKLVAVKRPLPRLCGDPDYVDMLADEASVSSDANHPCIRNVFDLGVAGDGSPYLVMEFLVGEPLSSVSHAMSERPELVQTTRHHRIVSRIIAGCCQGMHAVHELTNRRGPRDVVHRDLTPHNLFALHDGTVRVTDFGIMRARARRQRESGQTVLKGKVAYMSPEYLANKPYNRRSDVWALGVVLWELLTGCRLFGRKREVDTFSAVVSAPIPRPSTLCGNVDRRLDDIIGKALARNVDQRYQTAHDMAQDLEAYLAHSGGAGAPDVGAWLRELLPHSLPKLTALVEATRELTATPSPHALAPQSSLAQWQRRQPPPTLSPNAAVTPTQVTHRDGSTPIAERGSKGRYAYVGR